MKTAILWSGGKDSALALAACIDDPELTVTRLVTTLSQQYERISMHGVRQDLLHQQAAAAGLPVQLVYTDIPVNGEKAPVASLEGFTSFPSNSLYEHHMVEALEACRDSGIEAIVAGDLFLEDLRAYREELIRGAGLEPLFPLWERDTKSLLEDFVAGGFEAATVCVDGERLDRSWAGRWLDEAFIADLPDGIDQCGENGEYHTFVTAAPCFNKDITTEVVNIVHREPFWFADLK